MPPDGTAPNSRRDDLPSAPNAPQESLALKKSNPLDRLVEELVQARFLSSTWNAEKHEGRTDNLDDSLNRIETCVNVKVQSTQQAAAAVKIAKKHGFGVMAIGAKSSGNKSFKGEEEAQIHGLNGWLGLQILQMQLSHNDERLERGEPTFLRSQFSSGESEGESNIVERDGKKYEAVTVLGGQATVLISQNPSHYSHRVLSWGGMTPAKLDEALNQVLKRKYPGSSFSTGIDLTTRGTAHLAAVMATGGQGPTRVSPSQQLNGLAIVDGNGEIKHLEGEEAKMQVGLNGLAGAIMEVDLEVLEEQEHEYGVFIPLQGSTETCLTKRFPKIMALLAKYKKGKKEHGTFGKLVSNIDAGFLIKGFEIVSREGMKRTHESESERTKTLAGGMHRKMSEKVCEVGLMINVQSDLDFETMSVKLQKILEFLPADCPETEEEWAETDEDYEIPEVETNEKLGIPTQPDFYNVGDMNAFKQVREGMAASARASKIEGPTKSTDLNIKINPEASEEEIEAAYTKIWTIYYKYISIFEPLGAQIFIYGHNHPGAAVGGGIDAHIRVTFPIVKTVGESDHLLIDNYLKLADNLATLSAANKALYEDLIALSDLDGNITVSNGEKALLLTTQFVERLQENRPDYIDDIWQYILKYGGRTFAHRDSRVSSMLRQVYPPRLHLEEDREIEDGEKGHGLLAYFAPDFEESEVIGDPIALRRRSILYWCQYAHDHPESVKIQGEIMGLIRDRLELHYIDRVYLNDSVEECIKMAKAHLGEAKIIEDPSKLNAAQKQILVIRNGQKVTEAQRKQADIIVYSGKCLGAASDLGLLVANKDALKGAKAIKKSKVSCMQDLAEIGCHLALELGYNPNSDRGKARTRLSEQEKVVTLDAYPTQINHRVIAEQMRINRIALALEAEGKERARNHAVANIKRSLMAFFKVNVDRHDVFFVRSGDAFYKQLKSSAASSTNDFRLIDGASELGLPVGLSAVIMPKAIAEAARSQYSEFLNVRAILQLGAALKDYENRFEDISGIVEHVRKNARAIIAGVDTSDTLVKIRNLEDHGAECGVYFRGLTRSLFRQLSEFGVQIGGTQGADKVLENSAPTMLEALECAGIKGITGQHGLIKVGLNVAKDVVDQVAAVLSEVT